MLLLGLCLAGPARASSAWSDTDNTPNSASPARLALSEITDQTIDADKAKPKGSDVEMLPLPDAESDTETDSDSDTDTDVDVDTGSPPETVIGDEVTGLEADVEVLYDMTQLPEPVRRMHALIVTAASQGDIEALRPLLGKGATRTELSISGYDGDPIEFLRQESGDGNGQETLAILLDILSAGYVHVDPGEPTEFYLWPYFYSLPLEQLDDRQKVELFRIITAGDYEEMSVYGAYIFYRTGIGPDGDWKFFLAGD